MMYQYLPIFSKSGTPQLWLFRSGSFDASSGGDLLSMYNLVHDMIVFATLVVAFSDRADCESLPNKRVIQKIDY